MFLSHVSILTRNIDIAILSICLLVRQSVRHVSVLDVNGLTLGMCRIDFLISVRFWFGFCKKNSDSVRYEFGSVQFKKTRFGSDIIVIYYSCNCKYYSDSG